MWTKALKKFLEKKKTPAHVRNLEEGYKGGGHMPVQ
jgi:hypothetical protein